MAKSPVHARRRNAHPQRRDTFHPQYQQAEIETGCDIRPLQGSAASGSEALAKAKAKQEIEEALRCDDERRRLIEESAYYRAERRGFEPGHEEEDWLEAEKDVDRSRSK